MMKADHNSHFIYEYETQELPLVDDFSIDRTRSRWSQEGDDGVTLIETIHQLVVGGTSTPDMMFMLDTTFFYTTDISGEFPVTTREALPEVLVTVNDLEVYPVEGTDLTVWPAYNVFDTIQSPSPDTIDVSDPDLIQDSLQVFSVAPAGGTYQTSNGSQPLVLWQDDDVYVNGTYPVDPPTIGVATFDGLSRTGMPYDFMNYSSYGLADRLTSVPIDLQHSAADSIYLSFFYQARGLSGDVHGQPSDSLKLEFYAPLEDLWYPIWSTPYDALDPNQQPGFTQVMIPIKEFRYLQDGFQMRFSNYATLSGAFDHWHLDYVRLAAQRTYDDTTIVDVAYLYPEASLLNTYTSVPYRWFEQSPGTLMADQVTMQQRNLHDEDRFITYGVFSGLEGGTQQDFGDGTNTSNNASSIFTSTHPLSGFVYETPAGAEAAFYETTFWTNATPDANRYNDTTRFIQEISNYYAYDDGSAEMAYHLTNAPGGKVAFRFDLLGPDSLRAIRIYFSPTATDPEASPHPSTSSFLLTVWSSLEPENMIMQNFSFSSPEYRDHGLNKFVEYELDSTIFVEGTIYVGWTQTNNVQMNVGFDRNRNNADKIFFNTGTGWANTGFEGSLMVRPVMVSAVDPFTSVEEIADPDQVLSIFPNPASTGARISINGDHAGMRVQLIDATGRSLHEESFRNNMFLSTEDLSNGLYIVRVIDAAGLPIATSRLIVQR